MDEGAHFTIDFIEQEHRDHIQTLVDILCVPLKQAYDLYTQSGCNIQAAINRKTNPEPQHNFPQHSRPVNNNSNSFQPFHSFQQDQPQYHPQQYDGEDNDGYASLPVARRRQAIPLRVQEECQFDKKFNKFLQFKRKKKDFSKNYKIKRLCTQQSNSIASKLFNKKPLKNQEKKLLQLDPYQKQVQKNLLKRRCLIKLGKGSMSESLQSSYKTSQPLILYHLAFDKVQEQNPQKSEKISKPQKKILRNKKMIIDITEDDPEEKLVDMSESESKQNNRKFDQKSIKNNLLKALLVDSKLTQLVNNQFLNFMMDIQNYDYEAYFKQYFQKDMRKKSYLTVLRVNVFDQIQFVGKVDLDEIINQVPVDDYKPEQNIKLIRDRLQQIRNKVVSAQKQEIHLHERYKLLQKGIYHYDYIKPPTTIQKKKIREDRQIIKMQEEEFMELQNQLREQKMKQVQKEELELKNKPTKQEILARRQKVRQRLKKYSEKDPGIMLIKFRLPSGKHLILNVSIKEKVSYLFDFIDSNEMESLGFQDQEANQYCQRKFDILRPQDRSSLLSKTEATLEQVFQGNLMQSLIIKQE